MAVAGRALDAEIAEKVMGWHRVVDYGYKPPQTEWHSVTGGYASFEEFVNSPDQIEGLDMWSPSTDIADAWRVFEKMAQEGPTIRDSLWLKPLDCVSFDGEKWSAQFAKGNPEGSSSETAPLAICLAALKAVA